MKTSLLMQRPTNIPQGYSTLLSAVSPPLTSSSHPHACRDKPGRALFPGVFTDVPFVGREREMAVLQASLEEACAGQGRLLLLAGQSGIGKTRLAHEFATQASQRGVQILLGRCYEREGAPPFWPWVQVIRTYVRHRDLEALQTEMGTGAAAIAQVIAEVHTRLPSLSIPPTLGPEQTRFRFFDSLTVFLKNVGHRQPLLLIFDDLQWADRPSLFLLQFLVRELREARLLIVGTYRDDTLDRQHPLTDVLGELVREPRYQRLYLQGLSHHEVARFIEIVAGDSPAEAMVASLYQQTEGNPFFLTEIVRLLAREGGLAACSSLHVGSCLALPQGVQEAINRRLHMLAAPCSYLLTVASVIGREFDLETLARVSGTASDQLMHTLDSAVTARILLEIPHATGRYSFAHPLIRETLCTRLPAAQRVRLHRQIGEVLEERLGRHAPPRPGLSTGHLPAIEEWPVVAELAYHFFEATREGDESDKAIGYAVQAGNQALTLLAYEEGVTHYERALQLLERFKPTHVRQRCEVLLALGDAQAKAGDTPQARRTLFRAADAARSVEAPELFARAALGFENLGIEVGLVDQPLVTLLEEALSVLGDEASALRARLLALLARQLYFSAASATRRAALSRQAVAMARRIGDTTALMAALDSQRLDLWRPEDVQERLRSTTEVVRLAEAAGDRERAMRGRIDRIADLLELGDVPTVEVEIDTYVQLAEELRQPRYLWKGQVVRAMRALMAGRFEEGECLAQQALAIGQRIQSQTAANFFGVQLFWRHRELGRLQELEGVVQTWAAQSPAVPAWRCALASLYSELGREAEARKAFEQLATNNFAALPRDNNWLIGATLLAETCAFLADTRHAATLYELLLPYAEHNIVVGDAAACNGPVSRLLGLLATTLTRWEEAAQHFQAALATGLRMGARPCVARTQYEYAALLLTRCQPGDPDQARELLDLALYTARELGMQGLVEKGLALRQRLPNVRVPSPTTEASQGDNIFRQEGDYWTLAYQGATCQIKDAKGLHYIAALLHAPGQEFSAIALVSTLGAGRGMAADQETVHDVLARQPSDVGPRLDAQARAAYTRRLHELRDELAEAQRLSDSLRATQAQAEMDFLAHELAAALGLGGRHRTDGSLAERARSTVTKSIKASVQKIRAHHPALGHNLATRIKTGTFCRYLPEPETPLFWCL